MGVATPLCRVDRRPRVVTAAPPTGVGVLAPLRVTAALPPVLVRLALPRVVADGVHASSPGSSFTGLDLPLAIDEPRRPARVAGDAFGVVVALAAAAAAAAAFGVILTIRPLLVGVACCAFFFGSFSCLISMSTLGSALPALRRFLLLDFRSSGVTTSGVAISGVTSERLPPLPLAAAAGVAAAAALDLDSAILDLGPAILDLGPADTFVFDSDAFVFGSDAFVFGSLLMPFTVRAVPAAVADFFLLGGGVTSSSGDVAAAGRFRGDGAGSGYKPSGRRDTRT